GDHRRQGCLPILGPEPDGDEPEDEDAGGECCLGHAAGLYLQPQITDVLRCPGLWHVAPPFERERWPTSPGRVEQCSDENAARRTPRMSCEASAPCARIALPRQLHPLVRRPSDSLLASSTWLLRVTVSEREHTLGQYARTYGRRAGNTRSATTSHLPSWRTNTDVPRFSRTSPA